MNILTKIFGRRREASEVAVVEAKALAPISRAGAEPNFIVPAAQARWLGAGVAWYTPQMVEQIFRMALAGDLVSQWEMFDLMEATWPRLSKNLGELKDAVASMEFTIEPWAAKGKEPSADAMKRAVLVEELLWGMQPKPDANENDLEDTIRDLMDARGKGISVLEIDWETRATVNGAAVGPRCTRWVHPTWYGYPNGLSGGNLELRLGDGKWQGFPDNKFIIGIAKNKTGHPLGAAMLHVLGWWWAASNFTSEWFLNFAQIFGQPIRWATYDPGMTPTDQAKLQQMLATMGSQSWGMFPDGAKMELQESAKAAGDLPQKALLDMADKVCDLVVLRQTLTSDVGAKGGGSNALGEVHERVLSGVKLSCAKWVCKTLGQMVRAICVLNFGNANECPYVKPPGDDEETPADLSLTLVNVKNAGLELTDEAVAGISERLGFEVQKAPSPAGGTANPPTAGAGAIGAGAQDLIDQGGDEEMQARRASGAEIPRVSHPTDLIAARRAKALGQVYRGSMAPFRAIVLASESREECLQKLTAAYADWSPAKLESELEAALQICAASGAASATEQ